MQTTMPHLNKCLLSSFKGLALSILNTLSLGFLALSPYLLSAATIDDLEFTLINNDTEYSVAAKDAATISGELTIPSTYGGKPVTEIKADAFKNSSSLTSIVLPETLTSIGSYAFYNCTSLTSINFPETLTAIGNHAFSDCYKLASITFQGSAPTLGLNVFEEAGTGVGVGGFTLTIYENHEASYADWRDLYTFNVIENPITGPVVLVLKTSYNPSNQAFSIITEGEDGAVALALQHTSNLGDAWATVSTLTYNKVTDSTSGTVTRTLTIDPTANPIGFYRLVSE